MHILAHFFFFPSFGLGFVGYFVPTIVALARGKHDAFLIFLLNFFLGWTVIAWILALLWALKTEYPVMAR